LIYPTGIIGRERRSKDSLQRLDSWEQPQAFGVVIFGDINVCRVIVLARQENVFSTTVVLTIALIPKRCLPHKPCSTTGLVLLALSKA
jgi:hypothetical protein